MEEGREELWREWIESWAEETGQGVPCMEAQADGAPCFELGRDCAECEEGFQSWLNFKRKKAGEG